MNCRKQIIQPHLGFQITPMVDVLFVTLIFFMVASVTAQLETKVGITVPTADSGIHAARDAGEIIINLDAAGAIFIQNVQMDATRLEQILRQVAQEYKDQPVIIRADAKTPHEHVMTVLDICRKVDIWNVAFATLPKSTPVSP